MTSQNASSSLGNSIVTIHLGTLFIYLVLEKRYLLLNVFVCLVILPEEEEELSDTSLSHAVLVFAIALFNAIPTTIRIKHAIY